MGFTALASAVPWQGLVRIVRIALEGGLTLWLAWLLAGLIWMMVEPDPVPDRTAQAAGVSAQDDGPDLALLARFDPFVGGGQGRAGQAGRTGDGEPLIDAPETSLDLKLFGVRVFDGEQIGTAIVQLPDNSQRAFAQGQEILDRVVLERIYTDRIIISRNGALESLFFDDRARDRAQRQQQSPLAASTPNANRGSAPSVSVGTAGDNPSMSRQAFLSLLEQVTLAPRRMNNRINGFVLRPGGNVAAMRELGILPGDIILRIGGVYLDSFEAFEELAEGFSDGARTAVQLERAGQPLTLSITITN